MTEEKTIKINEAWDLLYKHLESCEDWSNGCKVNKTDFIEFGKKEFIIIPIGEHK